MLLQLTSNDPFKCERAPCCGRDRSKMFWGKCSRGCASSNQSCNTENFVCRCLCRNMSGCFCDAAGRKDGALGISLSSIHLPHGLGRIRSDVAIVVQAKYLEVRGNRQLLQPSETRPSHLVAGHRSTSEPGTRGALKQRNQCLFGYRRRAVVLQATKSGRRTVIEQCWSRKNA